MIDFGDKTYRNILARQLAKVPDTIDKREGSIIQTALGPESWFLEGLYLDLDRVQKNAYAGTAGGVELELICEERGIYRKFATPAVKKGIFNVSVPIGSRFSTRAGDNVTYAARKALGGTEGAYVYELECETAGRAGNSYSGPLLSIDYIKGLASAELSELIEAGTEDEEDADLRARYFATFETEAFAGNIAAYRNEILGMNGVGAVQVYPAWKGGGTVLCRILNGNLDPADSGLLARVQEAICPPEDGGTDPSRDGYGFAPIGAAVTIGTAAELVLNIECNIQFGTSGENHQEEVEQKILDYVAGVKRSWGERAKNRKIKYSVIVYEARIVAAILTLPDVVNVTNVTINGIPGDLVLTESPELQQLPVLGEVTIHAS